MGVGNTLTAGLSYTVNRVEIGILHQFSNAAAYAQFERNSKMDFSAGMRLECYKIDTLDFDSNIYFKYLDRMVLTL